MERHDVSPLMNLGLKYRCLIFFKGDDCMKQFKKESDFQSYVIGRIQERFPGSIVTKQDARQGIPDLLVLYEKHWAALENKIDKDAHHQPNQDWYVSKMNEMSYASFVYPENVEEVLNEMEQSFQTSW